MYKLYMHVALAVMNEEQQYDISVLMLQGYFCLARHLLLYRVDRCLRVRRDTVPNGRRVL